MITHIKFKSKRWQYAIVIQDNVIGINGCSGTGKTKLADDLERASLSGIIKIPVILIKNERQLYNINWSKICDSIVVLDNLEKYSASAIDYLSDLIQQSNGNQWIQIGHSNWIVEHYNGIKKLNVNERTRMITLE